MGNLFGIRRRAPVVTAQDRAILQMKQQRDKIKIYQKKTEQDLEKNKELAWKLVQNGMKDRALVVLRRKKCMEEILSRTDKQLETLEQLVSDIEYTQIEVSVVEGLKVGTEALKQLNSLMNIDDIQQMMDDNEEAAEKQKEISAILQHSQERYDEDELLKELDTYRTKETSVPNSQKDDQKTEPAEVTPDTTAVREETSDVPKATVAESGIISDKQLEDLLPEVPEELPSQKTTPTKQKTRQLAQ